MGAVVVLIVCVGLLAGYLSGNIPVFQIGIGALAFGVLFVIGGIFSRDHNKDRDINGEIETKLQAYTNRHARLLSMAMMGHDVTDKLAKCEQEEACFRETIEYGVVTDGRENYYSYRKGMK